MKVLPHVVIRIYLYDELCVICYKINPIKSIFNIVTSFWNKAILEEHVQEVQKYTFFDIL